VNGHLLVGASECTARMPGSTPRPVGRLAGFREVADASSGAYWAVIGQWVAVWAVLWTTIYFTVKSCCRKFMGVVGATEKIISIKRTTARTRDISNTGWVRFLAYRNPHGAVIAYSALKEGHIVTMGTPFPAPRNDHHASFVRCFVSRSRMVMIVPHRIL